MLDIESDIFWTGLSITKGNVLPMTANIDLVSAYPEVEEDMLPASLD